MDPTQVLAAVVCEGIGQYASSFQDPVQVPHYLKTFLKSNVSTFHSHLCRGSVWQLRADDLAVSLRPLLRTLVPASSLLASKLKARLGRGRC